MNTVKIVQFTFPVKVLAVVFLCCLLLSFKTVEVQRMTKDELKKQLDNPDLIVLDVRTLTQWEQSDYMIRGAKRIDDFDAVNWDSYPKDKILVLYCS